MKFLCSSKNCTQQGETLSYEQSPLYPEMAQEKTGPTVSGSKYNFYWRHVLTAFFCHYSFCQIVFDRLSFTGTFSGETTSPLF